MLKSHPRKLSRNLRGVSEDLGTTMNVRRLKTKGSHLVLVCLKAVEMTETVPYGKWLYC